MPLFRSLSGAIRLLGWTISLLTGCWLQSHAQTGNLRVKWIKSTGEPQTVDSLTIAPGTLKVLFPAQSPAGFRYDATGNTLGITGSNLPDSMLISYRTFPVNLTRAAFHRDPKSYDTIADFGGKDPLAPSIRERREEFFATKGITKSGSLTRGISFGNAQNVFVNSALNLQLEGQLSDDVTINAVISDQNVPYQPEGNTQQLRDFDRVFVQLTGKGWKLMAGDVVLRNPVRIYGDREPAHFLRYYRSVQGGQAEARYTSIGGSQAVTSVGVAISKGKFASMPVPVNEGVQGPYRLRGPANERFIIVLANSERVYLDGRLLERGFEYDYVVDYNTAEITFTPNVVITQYSRVRVDFEYSDRNYSRTILTAAHRQERGKFRFFTNFYQEKDNPRNPLTLQLTDADKIALQAAGDQTEGALLPAVSLLETYSPSLISYRQVDTLIEGWVYRLYQYENDPSHTLYQLQFTEVGLGQGNYQLLRTTANGRIYGWVAPQSGIPQGSFEPVRLVPLPAQRNLLAVGGEYAPSSEESFFAEGAFSKLDQNLYSPLNAGDDNGQALKIGYVNRGKPLALVPGYAWVGGIDFERDSRFFRPVDRFRAVEFDRDWSIDAADTLPADDHIFNVRLGIQKMSTSPASTSPAPREDHPLAAPQAVITTDPAPSASFLPPPAADRLMYRFSWRERGDAVSGWQQSVEGTKTLGNLLVQTNAFWLRSEKENTRSEWTRLQATASYRTKFLIPGYSFSLDKNRLTSRFVSDSVVGSAIDFEENRVFMHTGDSLRTRWRADYSIRQDYVPLDGRMAKNTLARMASTNLQTSLKGNDIGITATYRTSDNLNPLRELPGEETAMGRLDWNGNWLGRSVRSELTYATATGRELRREYVFLPVPTGAGTHTWRDDNGDGKQQLNEFYEAINPDEKNFAKFFVPTDEYVRAYTQNFSYRLNLTAPAGWRAQGPVLSVLSRLSSVSAWTISRKTTASNGPGRWIPLVAAPDTSVLSTQEAVRSALFYNRASPVYGLDLNWLRTQNRQLLTGGFEARNADEWRLNGRLNLGREYSLRGTAAHLLRGNRSDFLTGRTYQVEARQIGPELAYQPRAGFRITGSYLYSLKQNTAAENQGENALSNALALEARWAKVSKSTLTATARRTLQFSGQVNSPSDTNCWKCCSPAPTGTGHSTGSSGFQRPADEHQLRRPAVGRTAGRAHRPDDGVRAVLTFVNTNLKTALVTLRAEQFAQTLLLFR